MLSENDLHEFYEMWEQKEAQQKRKPNHLLAKQLQILEEFMRLEARLREIMEQ